MAQDLGWIHSVALLGKKLTVRFITQGNKKKYWVAYEGLAGIPIKISPTNIVVWVDNLVQLNYYQTFTVYIFIRLGENTCIVRE